MDIVPESFMNLYYRYSVENTERVSPSRKQTSGKNILSPGTPGTAKPFSILRKALPTWNAGCLNNSVPMQLDWWSEWHRLQGHFCEAVNFY